MGDPASDPVPTVSKRMYYLFVGNVASTLILAVTAIAMGRLLGPGGYGLYTLALVMPGYVSSVGLLGLPFAATRFPAKYSAEGDRKRAVSFIHSLTFAEGIIGLAGSLVLLPFAGYIATHVINRPSISYLIPVALVSVFGQLLYQTATAGFQGLNRMDRSAQLQVAQAAVKLVVSLALVAVGFGVAGAVVGYSVAFLVSGLLAAALVALLSRMLIPANLKGDLEAALRYSAPVFLSNLLGGVVPAYLVTLLARYSSDVQIGGYGASQNLVALISLFIYPIATVLFPHFSGIAHDQRTLESAYETSVKYSTIFIVPVAMVMMSLATPLASAVYGRAYSFAGSYLFVLVMPYLFAGTGSLAQVAFLNGIGETRKTLVVGLAGSAVTFVLGALLAPFFSIYGVLAASVAGNVVSYFVAARMIKGILGRMDTIRRLWKVYLVSVAGAIVVYPITFVPLHPLITVMLGVVAFFIVLIPLLSVSGAVKEDDVQEMKGFFSEMGVASKLFDVVVAYYGLFRRKRRTEGR